MAFIGNTPTTQAFTPAVDVFSGNGSTTAFTLSRPVASVAQVQAFIENVPQSPVDAFTVNGNTITFTSAPPSGSSNIYVRYTSPITQVIQPGDGTVTPAKLDRAYVPAAGGTMTGALNINGATVNTNANWGAYINPKSGGAVGDFTITDPTGNFGRLNIDGSGRVTMPYQPMILVDGTVNGDTTYNNAVWKEGTASAGLGFSKGGMSWSAATGRVTVPVDGYYRFQFKAYFTNSASMTGNQRLEMRKNSSVTLSLGHMTGGNSMPATITFEWQGFLAANDYIDMYSGSTFPCRLYGGGGHTFLIGALVG